MYYEVTDNKRADTTASFLEKALDFFPFKVTKVLTDNWKEYTLKHTKSKNSLDLKWAFDFICDEYWIEHRTTTPYTPQTNWMVERVNNIIKTNTLKIHQYNNISEMKSDLSSFLVDYNLFRRHSSLRTEINVKTPFEAIEYWFNLNPDLFKENPIDFKSKILKIRQNL